LPSPPGGNSTIWVSPYPPLDLMNIYSITNETLISISWTPGISDGGTPVIDYTIWYS
jgi:hypothetical protein